MKIVFGRVGCSACKRVKFQLEKKGEKFKYFDLDTPEGMAEAAYRGLVNDSLSLPMIKEETQEDENTF